MPNNGGKETVLGAQRRASWDNETGNDRVQVTRGWGQFGVGGGSLRLKRHPL